MNRTVSVRYADLVQAGDIVCDAGQEGIVALLDDLASRLEGYEPARLRPSWQRLFARKRPPPPQGVYLWGGVGRGKTMLMDLFFEAVRVGLKRRLHFHAFMQEVHGLARKFRQSQSAGLVEPNRDPIAAAAAMIADEAGLLCLDEFQVTDIADAMILGRLFEALVAEGVVIVTTSNTRPRDLYRDGLNRVAFLPFIDFIEASLEVVPLDGDIDYRLQRLAGQDVYFCPLGPGTEARMQWLWQKLTATDRGRAQSLTVNGRTLEVPEAARQAARFSFADLCQKPLGAADYLAIADRFPAVFLERIPALARERRDEAKRFVTLIDTFYDRHTRLVASAEAPPEHIYPANGMLPEIERTVSRLREMQSADWWSA